MLHILADLIPLDLCLLATIIRPPLRLSTGVVFVVLQIPVRRKAAAAPYLAIAGHAGARAAASSCVQV